jgi:hypothetical protein
MKIGRDVLERARGQLERAGAAGLGQLRRTGSRVAESVGTAAERLKESPTAEKLGAAVEARRALRRASEAEAAGDFAAAFALLASEMRDDCADPRLARAFLRAAVACERPAEAAPPMLRAIRGLASRGDVATAATDWEALFAAAPKSRADARTLLRIAPELAERDPSLARHALRHAVEADTRGMTPGLAVRVADLARELDPPTAIRAAEIALRAPGLHEKRRGQLHRLVVELGRAMRRKPAPHDAGETKRSPDDVVGGLAPLRLCPPDLRPGSSPPVPPECVAASREAGTREAEMAPDDFEDFSGWLEDDGELA